MKITSVLLTKMVGFSLVLHFFLIACDRPTPDARPNVIIVLTDDQGYGDLSCHGNPVLKTPNFDRLHSESIRFTDFHVAPMCTPTRGQLMTGRDAKYNGASMVCLGRSMVREDLPTMADIFKGSGYQTAHFGKWHLGDSYPYRPQDRGFDETVHHGAWGITSIADYPGNDYWDDTYEHNGTFEEYEGYCTDVWFDLALERINGWEKGDKPQFIYLPTNCPHTPHWVDDEYSDPYLEQGMTPRVAKFFGMIVNIDENIKRLLSALDETGQADNTILIFMGDNGTATGEGVFNAGMRGRKTQLWEGGHRVPLFIRWPDGNIGEVRDIDALTQVQDILPTLIDLCGLQVPGNISFDGVSLAPLLSGEEDELEDRKLVVDYRVDHDPQRNSAVLWNKWRLVHYDELYDLASDPHQDNDVAAQYPDVVSAMQKHYDDWWIRTEPEYEKTRFIHIGSEKQNPIMLYSSDWHGSYADNFGNLKAGDRIGAWDVIIETEGEYEVTLSRWHPETNTALDDSLTQPQGVGNAIPIAKARLKIGEIDLVQETREGQTEVNFTVNLKAGENLVQTWFQDENGKELCSAYYTEFKLK